ncbi:unnamed protein product, partial [Lymnaea stagnalis]
MITTFVVLSNITIVAAMLVSRDAFTTNNDHNITKLLMASMACVDILIGTFHMPISVVKIINNGKWILGTELCSIWYHIGNAFCGVTASHILCIAVDKYLAVGKPLVYRVLTKRFGYITILISWTLPSAMFLLPLVSDWFGTTNDELTNGNEKIITCSSVLNKNILLLFYSLGIYLPVLTTYILYGLIISEIWKFNKRKSFNAKNHVQVNFYSKKSKLSTISETPSNKPLSNQESHSKRFCENINTERDQQSNNPTSYQQGISKMTRRFSRNMKAIRTLGTIVLCFTFCWMPVWIYVAIYSYHQLELPSTYILFIGWLAYTNSAVNPVLYSFF